MLTLLDRSISWQRMLAVAVQNETDADFNITGAARAVLIGPGQLAPNPTALLPLLPQFRR